MQFESIFIDFSHIRTPDYFLQILLQHLQLIVIPSVKRQYWNTVL